MKAHVDVESGLVHTVVDTAANVHDVTQATELLPGQEERAHGDAGYQGYKTAQKFRKSMAKSRGTWQCALVGGAH